MPIINKNEFWQYAYSNFIDNRNRGALGEFIVASAMSVTETPYSSWENYDLEAEGIKIEVKTSGFQQTWEQKKESVPSFEIRKKKGWVGETNEWEEIAKRHADVYVFCLNTQWKGSVEDPLNTEHWKFYVASTKLINEKLSNQQTLGISTIENTLGCKAVSYDELRDEIEAKLQSLNKYFY